MCVVVDRGRAHAGKGGVGRATVFSMLVGGEAIFVSSTAVAGIIASVAEDMVRGVQYCWRAESRGKTNRVVSSLALQRAHWLFDARAPQISRAKPRPQTQRTKPGRLGVVVPVHVPPCAVPHVRSRARARYSCWLE